MQDQTASAKLTAWWGTDYLLLGKYDGRWMISSVRFFLAATDSRANFAAFTGFGAGFFAFFAALAGAALATFAPFAFFALIVCVVAGIS